MLIGILREIRAQENRVSMTPAGVEVMKQHGHTVLVEQSAGAGSDFSDTQYAAAGATIMETPGEIYARADLVMHVKEPQPSEYGLIRPGQVMFTYLSFCIKRAADPRIHADRLLSRLPMKPLKGPAAACRFSTP